MARIIRNTIEVQVGRILYFSTISSESAFTGRCPENQKGVPMERTSITGICWLGRFLLAAANEAKTT